MNQAIEIRDLVVNYRSKSGKEVEAVRGLTCSVAPGEVVGFLGPNGAGKSSTLKQLMGFVQAASGESLIFGSPPGTPETNRRIGYLPEVALYYPYLTPSETLRLYGEVQGLGGKALRIEIDHLLEVVGIAHARDKQNRTLSKGMLQRVGIAQSLLGNPELLILDEVTSGLDPLGRRELREILKNRKAEGCTLFFSSHELAEVEMLCDRILVIHQGRLVEERLLPALKDELRQYAIEFVAHTDLSDLTSEVMIVGPQQQRAIFDSKEKLIEATRRITLAGGKITDVVSQGGSLEDYFIRTISEAA